VCVPPLDLSDAHEERIALYPGVQRVGGTAALRFGFTKHNYELTGQSQR
jgi:hypothetical protein